MLTRNANTCVGVGKLCSCCIAGSSGPHYSKSNVKSLVHIRSIYSLHNELHLKIMMMMI